MPTLVISAAQKLMSAASDHRAESLRLKAAGLYWLAAAETIAAVKCEQDIRNRVGITSVTADDIALVNRYAVKGI